MVEFYKYKKVYVAVKGDVIVGGLEHPAYVPKGATSSDKEWEKAFKESVAREARYDSHVTNFHKRYDGADIRSGTAADWLTFVLTEEDLAKLKRILGLKVESLG